MERRILIVGSGALATLFAYSLSAGGVDVTMMGSWPEGIRALRNYGAKVLGKTAQKVKVIENPLECGRVKYALVLVKSWQTESAATHLAQCIEEDGLAVTLQNGLGNDAVLAKTLGHSRIGRGITTMGATLTAPGTVSQSGNGEVVIEDRPKMKEIVDILRIGNINVKIVKDATSNIWDKLVVNTAINPIAAILGLKNGELLENRHARMMMSSLARETAGVAKSLGIRMTKISPEKRVEEVAALTSENVSSMLQDLRRGAPTEVDAINGAVIQEGKKVGVITPNNWVMQNLINAIVVNGKITAFPTTGGA